MAVLKYSKQREAIRDFLAHSEEHPTADMVYMNLRESFPNISLGTVYRNLSLLSETGQILKLNMRDSADRFDGRITPHDHFVCERCHCVEDNFLDELYREYHINRIQAVRCINANAAKRGKLPELLIRNYQD